jgi:5'(3')-deoxyribonucleotidase
MSKLLQNSNKIIYVDVDDTVADTRMAIVRYYRQFTGDKSTDFLMKTDYDFSPLCPQWTPERMRQAFMDPVFFSCLKPFPGARNGIDYLLSKGYDVRFCTAHRPEGEMLKRAWCREVFPKVKKIIVTEPFKGKDEYEGYAFIDDGTYNLVNNKSQIRILFDIYEMLSCDDKDIIRVTDWSQVEEFL